MSDRFAAQVRTEREGCRDGLEPRTIALVALHGPLDGRAVADMEAAWLEVVATGAGIVLLDFGQVGYVNSTGIALVVALLARSQQAAIEVRACGLSEHYQHVFELTRITDFVAIHTDTASALAGAPA